MKYVLIFTWYSGLTGTVPVIVPFDTEPQCQAVAKIVVGKYGMVRPDCVGYAALPPFTQ